jgi:hypothetical protein
MHSLISPPDRKMDLADVRDAWRIIESLSLDALWVLPLWMVQALLAAAQCRHLDTSNQRPRNLRSSCRTSSRAALESSRASAGCSLDALLPLWMVLLASAPLGRLKSDLVISRGTSSEASLRVSRFSSSHRHFCSLSEGCFHIYSCSTVCLCKPLFIVSLFRE